MEYAARRTYSVTLRFLGNNLNLRQDARTIDHSIYIKGFGVRTRLCARSKARTRSDLRSSLHTRWAKNCQNQKGSGAESYPQLPSCFASLHMSKALPSIEYSEMLASMENYWLPVLENLCNQGVIDYFVKYDVLSNRSHLLPFTFSRT